MKIHSFNNRFLDESEFNRILSVDPSKLFHEFGIGDEGFKHYARSQSRLLDIASQRDSFIGHNEMNSESEFTNDLVGMLGAAKYPRPNIKRLNGFPDYTISDLEAPTYRNLYDRSTKEFWNSTRFILEVKPMGFDLSGTDPTTGKSWIEKCAMFCRETGVPYGIVTDFLTYYVVRISNDGDYRSIVFNLVSQGPTQAGMLSMEDPEALEDNASAIARILTLLRFSTSAKSLEARFESLDNEELDRADGLLPRFIDAISVTLDSEDSKQRNNDQDLIRHGCLQVFCLWSVLSRSELISSQVLSRLTVASDYLEHLKSYTSTDSAADLEKLNKACVDVISASRELMKKIVSFLPEALTNSFREYVKFELSIDQVNSVAALLFVERVDGEITIRGAHSLGASSISTIFEGSLSYKIKTLGSPTLLASKHWNQSSRSVPRILDIRLLHVMLIEPPQESDKKRKKLGAYFTPTPLCDYMIGQIDMSSVDDKPLAFDPTCGTGQFLLSFIRTLSRRSDVSTSELVNCIAGNDIEPTALFVTAYRIASLVAATEGKAEIKRLQLFNRNFTSPEVAKEIFGDLGEVDIIVGNPPFGAETLSDTVFSNTWQSCLDNCYLAANLKAIAVVLPASFANSSDDLAHNLRNKVIERSKKMACVAFDTRPVPIFPQNDQRVLFLISHLTKRQDEQRELTSGGYRRHVSSKSISQSLSEISWQKLTEEDVKLVYPLPMNESEKNLLEHIMSSNVRSKAVPKEAKKKAPSGKYEISVLAYGRYSLNAIMGAPPVGGGKRWRRFRFEDEEMAARVVVGLNSNLGWSLFRILTNGLDFNSSLVEFIKKLPAKVGKNSSCIDVAKKFSKLVRDEYRAKKVFRLEGRIKEYEELNRKISAALSLKEHGIDLSKCSDLERLRVLKGAA